MSEFRNSLRAPVAASLLLLVGACSTSPPVNTLTGPLAFTVDGSGGGSGPVTVSGGGAGVGLKILLADVSLADVCVSGADITCAPNGQRVEIDITHAGAIPLGMPLSIATGVDVLRQSIVGGTTCSSTLGTAISGSVTITSSNSQHIAGTFSVTLQAPDGSTSTLSGTFDVNFCQALVPGGGTTGGTSGGTSSGGSSTGGASGGTTTGASSSGGQTSGGSSSGTTGGSSSSGGTTGGGPCAPGATWQGDYCTVASCVGQPDQGGCTLAAGGRGQCFGGACVAPIDLDSDSSNCGFYGAVCPIGSTCIHARCSPDLSCDGAQCLAGGDICVTNPFYTRSGVCVPDGCSGVADGRACPASSGGVGACCGGSCLDTPSDSANCGGCGVVCGAGTYCNLGRCQPVPDCTTAPSGTRCNLAAGSFGACCGGVCTDVSSDAANCGACGLHCLQTMSCISSTCFSGDCASAACDPGLVCTATTYCALQTCAATSDGLACALSATAIGVCCQSACLDLKTDASNCGACGRACGAGTQCIQEQCVPPLSFDCAHNPGVQVSPTAYCCDGKVVDVSTDALNCGQCGIACPVTATCQGYCQLPGGGVVFCDANNACPAGTACAGNACESTTCTASQQGQACVLVGAGPPVPGSCCSGTCVDIASDSNNCTSCGQVCPNGSTCRFYSCLDVAGGTQPCINRGCAAGLNCSGQFCLPTDCTGRGDLEACSYGPGVDGQCCNGTCVDLRQTGNCTACGSDCPSGICAPSCLTEPTPDCPQSCAADSICILGQCVDGLCRGSGTTCAMANGSVGYCCGDTACADLANDPDSCGTCDVHCPAGQTCANGICSGADATCKGRAGGYCNLVNGAPGLCCGGGCIDVQSDAKNCGNCGVACGGTLPCAGGVCGG